MRTESKNQVQVMDPEQLRELILYDDPKIQFVQVIACLVKYCGHDPLQSEQLALIAHSNGKASIKRGDYTTLLDLKFVLQENKLTVEIT